MDATHPRTESTSWLWIAAIWSGIGLFDATQTVFTMRSQGMHHAWTQLYVTQLLGWLPWALATPVAMFLARRYPPNKIRNPSTWFVHLSAAVGVNFAWTTWMTLLEITLNPWLKSPVPDPFLSVWPIKFYNLLLSSLILYAFIQAISFVLRSRQQIAMQQTETARLNEQLSNAQLNALRRQLEPHFLFNTLNAIAGLVREQKNDAAVSTIARLSDFLRRVVKDSNRAEVPLLEEVEFLEQYLEIQKVRLGERLQMSVDVPRELLQAQVPNLVLQPLVENAIKHGIAKRAQGGAVRIDASRIDDILYLNVYNDGPSLSVEWERANAGTGISNLRNRLQILYGTEFTLNLQNRETKGVVASVAVPFREE